MDSRKKTYVRFIENQVEKPAVVVRLTNQLWKAWDLSQEREKKGEILLENGFTTICHVQESEDSESALVDKMRVN